MSGIVHESAGALLKQLDISGVTFPSQHLIMLVDNNALSGYSEGSPVSALPNQYINTSLPELTSITAGGWDAYGMELATLSLNNLNGNKLTEMRTRYLNVFPWSPSRTRMASVPNGATGIRYAPGIGGISHSFLIYPDVNFCTTQNPSFYPPSTQYLLGIMEIGSGNFTGLMCGTDTVQWKYFRGNISQTVDIGTYPELDKNWYHIIIVETVGVSRSVKIYINGELALDHPLVDRVYTGNIITLNHLNSMDNAVALQYNGYYAHGATWLKALTAEEINIVIGTINNQYGLSNPLIEEGI